MLPALCCGAIALLASRQLVHGQSTAGVDAPTQTLRVSTQIVLLDVAVIDKKGQPANAVLGPDDFTITEDGKPQRLLSFEPPATRAGIAKAVFVLDQLNAGAADRGYYAVCLEQYLRSQPELLTVPTEVIALNASSLRVVQPATRSRAKLLAALLHLPASGDTLVNLRSTLFSRTLNALELVAVKSLGEEGRTAVVWLGPGNGIDLSSLPSSNRPEAERFIRYMTNTLLESRTTLYVVFPPDTIGHSTSFGNAAQVRSLSDTSPYSGGVNFGELAGQTGGASYTATNDLAAAMRNALGLGRNSYSMSYHPTGTATDGSFRHINVTLRNTSLHVVTKSGYYAPEAQEEGAPQTLQVFQMAEVGNSTLPFTALSLRVTHLERTPNAQSIEVTVPLQGSELTWRREGEGSLAELTAGVLAFAKDGRKLSSEYQNVSLLSHSQDPAVLERATPVFKVTLQMPANADHARLVVSSRKNGRVGCLDISHPELSSAMQPTAATATVP